MRYMALIEYTETYEFKGETFVTRSHKYESSDRLTDAQNAYKTFQAFATKPGISEWWVGLHSNVKGGFIREQTA